MKSEFLYVKGQSIRNKTHFVWGGKGGPYYHVTNWFLLPLFDSGPFARRMMY